MNDDTLTLRDRFAMAAIDAAAGKLRGNDRNPRNVAYWAYQIADAMIDTRGGPDDASVWQDCSPAFAHMHLTSCPAKWVVRRKREGWPVTYYTVSHGGGTFISTTTSDGVSDDHKLGAASRISLTLDEMRKQRGWQWRLEADQ